MTGSQHNDPFYNDEGRIRTRTNRSGGVQGGISNGENIVIRAAFKPTATILRTQETVDVEGNPTTLEGRGRHDPCVLAPRRPHGGGDDGAGSHGSDATPARAGRVS